MRDTDTRLLELFGHPRHSFELLEQITIQSHRSAAEPKRTTEVETKLLRPSIPPTDIRLSCSVKEVCKLVGISTATLYQVLGRRELKAVKLGNKTLILAKDLEEWLGNLPAMR
jgi:excisionase family DNA binding protein